MEAAPASPAQSNAVASEDTNGINHDADSVVSGPVVDAPAADAIAAIKLVQNPPKVSQPADPSVIDLTESRHGTPTAPEPAGNTPRLNGETPDSSAPREQAVKEEPATGMAQGGAALYSPTDSTVSERYPLVPSTASGTPIPGHGALQQHAGNQPQHGIPPVSHHGSVNNGSSACSVPGPYTVTGLFGTGGYHLPEDHEDGITPAAYADQCNELHNLINHLKPGIVRRVVRDQWKRTLSGTESHIAFVVCIAPGLRLIRGTSLLSAQLPWPCGLPVRTETNSLCQLNMSVHMCSGTSAQVAVSRFGKNLAKNAAREFAGHLTADILETIADIIVAKAPDTVLDKCMAKRLDTIPARQLLNMLARAERLGYDANDIVDDTQGIALPDFVNLTPSAAGRHKALAPGPPPTPALTGDSWRLSCPNCPMRFVTTSARDFVSFSKPQACCGVGPTLCGRVGDVYMIECP
jgi:hypothetical protein